MKKITARQLGFWAFVIALIALPLSAETENAKRVVPGAAAATPAKAEEAKPARKLVSAEPDPSLVLEPVEEDPVEAKKAAAKPAPKRPIASAPAGGKSPASIGGGKANLKLGGRLGGGEIQSGPEVAVILVGKQFFPSRIRLKEGLPTRLYLTTTNDRPAAVVVEQLQVQRWIAKEGGKDKPQQSELERAKFEVRREVATQRVTEIQLDPIRGTYSFHDVIGGAKGQITVE